MSSHRQTQQAVQTVQQLRIMIGAFMAGMILFAGVTVYLIQTGFTAAPELARTFGIVLAGLGALLTIVARLVGRALETSATSPTVDSAANDRKKVQTYLTVKLLRAAFSEAWGLVGTVFLLITGNWYFLAAPVLACWLLLRIMPRGDDAGPLAHRIGPGASTHGGAIEP